MIQNKILKTIIALVLIAAGLFVTVCVLHSIFPRKHSTAVNKYCTEYKVDQILVYALIKAESNFDSRAVSHADAKGIMQLTDETFLYCLEKLGINQSKADIFDPDLNIRTGVWYLSVLLKRYDGNIRNAVAAYNAGAANVDRWLSSPLYSADGVKLDKIPFGETDRHIKKIDRYTNIYSFLY